MTMTNREVFFKDPNEGDIPNLGVAKVRNPEDDKDWATLDWELRSFVCEGEYERGLERILDQFVSHLSQNEQPAVWVSGFFGSGKSHLMRVLEYLWRDYPLPSGVSARELTVLPQEIKAHLVELSNAGKRAGGLWSAAGTLGSGAPGSVRLAFLAIVLDSAGLPQQYAPAKLAIWLKNEKIYDKVVASVIAAGQSVEYVLRNLYVDKILAQALIDAGATFGETVAEVSKTLQRQFPMETDISNEEMLVTFEAVMKLQSTAPDRLPLTLIVLDEMQQYIGDDNGKALNVQNLVEACSAHFGSQVLIVATGQSALTANSTLQKLIDRFSVTVALSDTDVETVVRKVVLRKKPDAIASLEEVLAASSGEIQRHLGGTRLAAVASDSTALVPDYPLLPTRRRFWEGALRAIDKAGKAGVLRTQLKIVHEAARSVSDMPIGVVIGADFLFQSESASMLQSGVLLKEIDELIRGLDDGTADGKLKSRACSLIFLISQLPHEGVGDTGVRADAPVIADLLVEDLASDGALLRKDVPRVLAELVEQGRVMKLGDEYRLQTQEGAEWTKDFNQRRASIREDSARMSTLRNDWLSKSVDAALAGAKLIHGESKTPRKLDRSWGQDEPTVDGVSIPLWIRDEWSVTEAKARESAASAGNESPIVFVLLPKIAPEAIRDALASWAAASDTSAQRSEPQTDEGRQAKQGMQSRIAEGERNLSSLFGSVIEKARVFQGGGNELNTSSLRDGVETAGEHALARQFPKFGMADNPNWGKVATKARDGAPDALSAVGYAGDVPAHPVCKEALARISPAGTKGNDLASDLSNAPYGWPRDAIDGALLALLASGNIRAEKDGQALSGPKELPPTQITKAVFYKEDEPPSMKERLAIKGLLTETGLPFVASQEAAALSGLLQHLSNLAAQAGGPPPLPEAPDISLLQRLTALAGNEQFRAIAEASEQLRQDNRLWTAASNQRPKREEDWSKLDRLINHAASLGDVEQIRMQRDAIFSDRLLLIDPDPITPLIESVCSMLRASITGANEEIVLAHARELSELEKSAEWRQIEAVDQQRFLVEAGLSIPASPAIKTDDELLRSLDATSLAAWHERLQALPAKAASAREAAARMLEPKSVTVKPPSATVKTETDVDAYLKALRAQLMGHVDAGETVII